MNLHTRFLIIIISVLLSSCSTLEHTKEQETTTRKPVRTDLFGEIFQGYKLEYIDNHTVNTHKKWYLKNAEYIQRVLNRSEPFLFFIVEEIKKRGLPMELAFLPVIESAYITTATSRSKASGLWQFIPSTGRYFGLKQNWWSNQRRDIILSTESALNYLEILNKEFNGDWHLAIAAYNGGRGTIRAAIKKNERKGLATDFFSLNLSRETTNYVPKLLALSHVLKNSELYNIHIPEIKKEPYFTVIPTTGQINLHSLVEKTSINKKEFSQLNAGFKRWASSPEGPHRVVIPLKYENSVRSYLASQPKKPNIKWHSHHLKNGDTLYGLSLKYNVSVKAIKSINNMHSNFLRAGRKILIPLQG